MPSQDPAWRVGGDGGITADNVILIGLIHVFKKSGPVDGMWRPILQLDRHIIP